MWWSEHTFLGCTVLTKICLLHACIPGKNWKCSILYHKWKFFKESSLSTGATYWCKQLPWDFGIWGWLTVPVAQKVVLVAASPQSEDAFACVKQALECKQSIIGLNLRFYSLLYFILIWIGVRSTNISRLHTMPMISRKGADHIDWDAQK